MTPRNLSILKRLRDEATELAIKCPSAINHHKREALEEAVGFLAYRSSMHFPSKRPPDDLNDLIPSDYESKEYEAFENGITFGLSYVAAAIGASNWAGGDGETVEEGLAMEIYNIFTAAKLLDAEGDVVTGDKWQEVLKQIEFDVLSAKAHARSLEIQAGDMVDWILENDAEEAVEFLECIGMIEWHVWDDEKHAGLDTSDWVSEPKNGTRFWLPTKECDRLTLISCKAQEARTRAKAADEPRAHAAPVRDAKRSNSSTLPYVMGFARLMEGKLAMNRHKGDRDSWSKMSPSWLLGRLRQEVIELEGAISSGNKDEIKKEAADVGNFSMMIADVAGGMIPAADEATTIIPPADLVGDVKTEEPYGQNPTPRIPSPANAQGVPLAALGLDAQRSTDEFELGGEA